MLLKILTQVQSKAIPCAKNTPYEVQTVKIGPPIFLLTLLPNPKTCALQCFSIG